MSSSPLRLVILARDNQPRIESARQELCRFLEQQADVEVTAEGLIDEISLQEADADVVVTLGGDGAILRACRKMGRRQLPLLGINLGRLGFLADLSPEEFRSSIAVLAARQYQVVEHLMFECDISGEDGSRVTHLGLNEVVISSAAALTMIDVELSIDGEEVTTYSGDGLILSTPIGSTAHSLSAGGPILRQDLQAFVVTPICPHTLTNRPLVDRADCEYRLRVPDSPAGVMLVIDGQIRRPVSGEDVIHVRKSNARFRLVRIPGHSYYKTLYRKLGWGGQPRYRTG